MVEKKRSEEIRKEKITRLEKTILNQKPDRVPFWPICRWFPARYAGIPYSEFFSNYEKQVEAFLKVARDFDFDGFRPEFGLGVGIVFVTALVDYPEIGLMINPFMTGPMHAILQDTWTRWPGYELSPDVGPQFIGGQFMEAKEYDGLIQDPIKFINQVALPRACNGLKKPGSPTTNATWFKFGRDSAMLGAAAGRLNAELRNLGYPVIPMGMTQVPLDFLADFLRHVTPALVDLYRVPDQIEKAVEALVQPLIQTALNTSRIRLGAEKGFDTTTTLVFMPLHLNEMLSPKLFEKFYWPGLSKVVEILVEDDLRPLLFFEGDFTPFLEYLLNLPKGKILAQFERTDLKKARAVLGDHLTIMGGLPTSHYILGTPDKVEEEVQKLFNDLKEPGAFIFVGSSVGGIPDEAKPECVRAAINAVQKYGEY